MAPPRLPADTIHAGFAGLAFPAKALGQRGRLYRELNRIYTCTTRRSSPPPPQKKKKQTKKTKLTPPPSLPPSQNPEQRSGFSVKIIFPDP